jgi:Protein of unknown function (DUF2695)
MNDDRDTKGDANDGGGDELIDSIAGDVMRVLADRGFFEKLDDRLCPVAELGTAESCEGKYEISDALLRSLGFDEQELEEIFQVLESRGGFCDCEILYSVSEANRLKAKYWRARATELDSECSVKVSQNS